MADIEAMSNTGQPVPISDGPLLTSSAKSMCVVGEQEQNHEGQEEEVSSRDSHAAGMLCGCLNLKVL